MLRKEISIGFRTDKAIKHALEQIAKDDRRSISSVIETILYHHLKDRNLLPIEDEPSK